MGFTLSSSAFAIPSIAFFRTNAFKSSEIFWSAASMMRNLGHWLSSWFLLVWFEVLFEAIFLCRVVHHMWGNSGHNPDPLSDTFINTGLGISPMGYSWLRQSTHTKMEKFPPECVPQPQPWLSYRRQCSQTLKHQYTTTLPLTLATTPFLPCDKRTKWPPWTKRPITHQHRVNVTKVSSRLTDKDSQPPVYQVGLGQRVYILPGALWAMLGHLPPIPQHPRTPGHKAFRSQLTANELSGMRFRRCRA